MPPALALALAATLAAPPAGSASGEAARPPAGSAYSLEGRAGGATCGYCGLMLGGAILRLARPFLGGVFVEVAAPVNSTVPTSTRPARIVGSYFFGGEAGFVGELWGRSRIGVAAEGGLQLASARADYSISSGLPSRRRTEAIPVLGGRASFELRLSSGGLLGIAAFVREPLVHPCMDVGFGCDPPATTYGVVLLGSLDLP
jgi:hypothetical protein